MPKVVIKEAFLRRGYYTVDQLAERLVSLADNRAEVRRAVRRALNKKHPKQRIVLYYLAYREQQKTGCAASTALKRTAGRRWRSLWDKLRKSRLSLEQVVKNTPDNF